MASKYTKSWEEVRAELPVNERLVALYDRLIESQEQIGQARRRRGETEVNVEEAFRISELHGLEDDDEYDVYLSELARFVAKLGGHVEVSAVFPEETIVVWRVSVDPGEPSPG